MLLDIHDEETGMWSRYLVDRETNKCIILKWVPKHLEQIVAQAEALGVPHIRMFVVDEATQLIETLKNDGWRKADLTVLERTQHGKSGLR